MTTKAKVPSFEAKDLREFIELECGGDLSQLSNEVRARCDSLNYKQRVFYYTADELLIEINSHLRFFEDWLDEQGKLGRTRS